jgi:hypothetical protein
MATVKKIAALHSRKPTTRKPAWQAVFATEEEYDKSVASVVARIKSGEVQPRVPDEEEFG